MLTCTPQSWVSWNYLVQGLSSGACALLRFDALFGDGGFQIGERRFDVIKGPLFSGRWRLQQGDQVIMEAEETSLISGNLKLRAEGQELGLRPSGAFTRGYDIVSHHHTVGTIRRGTWLSRRVEVICDGTVPELTQLFAFWLAVTKWRRNRH